MSAPVSLAKELRIGCGDNSCCFGPRGVGTNGGCRCFEVMLPERRVELRRGIYLLREVAELPHVLAALRFIIEKERSA